MDWKALAERSDRFRERMMRQAYADDPVKLKQKLDELEEKRKRPRSSMSEEDLNKAKNEFKQFLKMLRRDAVSLGNFVAGINCPPIELTREQFLKDDEARARFERLLSDPNALAALSQAELDHARLSAESEIAKLEEAVQRSEAYVATRDPLIAEGISAAVERAVLEFKEEARKRRLLVNMITAIEQRKAAPNGPDPEGDAEAKRRQNHAKVQSTINRMKRDRHSDVNRMREEGASEEEIKRRENMWDDGIAKEEEELRKWL